MTDEDKVNVVAFYIETDAYYDVPEHLVEPGDTVVSYLDPPDESEDDE